MSTKVFQLSALSQNDPGASDGSVLSCKIIGVCNGTLREGSFPVNENVQLPIPPGENKSAPATPTWFLIPENGLEGSFTIEVFSPTDPTYPSKTIAISETDVKNWAKVPFNNRENQIYQDGEYGIFGFAQEGPIYTITAGVLNPRKNGN
ncbi:hypothetical protein CXF68_07735 [Tenacibaculum sp. Bg11-29]|uniref:hypothetical protein n=1 Tax=Tenacibaculum sp. Bg11-29 TaxID=2058306 RepID=UPI000C32849C|nr:hypothetical protein [Tenacibaculum sp. Bg11-29]PKH50592.1 hypothetical protein CXF68_07735 [Tenacibaculum sp. Bg11-29]